MRLDHFLNIGEKIILQEGRHWIAKAWVMVVAVFVLIISLLFILAGESVALIGVAILLGSASGLIAGLLQRKTYAITTQRVIVLTSHLFSRKMEELPLEHAAVIEVRQRLLGQIFGCGDLVMNPSKINNNQVGEIEASVMKIDDIRNPADFRLRILQQRERLHQERMGLAVSMVAAVATAQPPKLAPPPSPTPAIEEAQWFYHRNGEQVGPISSRELKRLAKAGQVGQVDLIWKQGLPNWIPAAKISGLF